MSDYSYLKNQKPRLKDGVFHLSQNNSFYPLKEEEIAKAEQTLGFLLPQELKDFYRQIGYGYLTTPYNADDGYNFYGSNIILPPMTAANFMKGILNWEHQEFYMSDYALEDFSAGDFPFFEVTDSCVYFVMKLNSENPNAVWTTWNTKIEDSFERFIWRLYYETPGYYKEII